MYVAAPAGGLHGGCKGGNEANGWHFFAVYGGDLFSPPVQSAQKEFGPSLVPPFTVRLS